MKKGFTLVELLAVIIVLSIVLVIAIPIVNTIISDMEMEAMKKNEEMMVSATKDYIVSNRISLPENIGDVVEVRLSDLIVSNHMEKIEAPSGNKECNGYVLITKMSEKQYNYAPYLNCENDIGSSGEDRLLAHYTFDDFQEPTINYLLNPEFVDTSYWNLAKSSGSEATFSSDGEWGKINVPQDESGNYYYLYQSSNIITPANSPVTFSVTFKNNTIGKFALRLIVYVNGVSTPTQPMTEVILDGSNIPKRYSITATHPEESDKLRLDILAGSYYSSFGGLSDESIEFSNAQLEQKSYETPFVDGTREGIVKDYSGNGNNAELTVNESPQWIKDLKIGSGGYKFDSISKIDLPLSMNNSNYGLPDAQYTFSMWVKLNNHNESGVGLILGMASYNGFGIFINSDGESYTQMGTYYRNSIGTYSTSSYNLDLNKWYYLIAVLDKVNQKVQFYVNGELFDERSINTDEFSRYDYPFAINRLSQTGGDGPWINMDGYIDDVRIYGRVLSDEEIEYMYKLTK